MFRDASPLLQNTPRVPRLVFALVLVLAAAPLFALRPSPKPLPFEITRSPIYIAYWILSLAIGGYASLGIAALAQKHGSKHLWYVAWAFLSDFLITFCAALGEINRLGPYDDNLPKIATMVFICFLPITLPRIVATRPELRLDFDLVPVFTVAALLLMAHYLASGAVFYIFEYRDGAAKYFDGHRVFCAFLLYIVMSLAMAYLAFAFIVRREHVSPAERKALRNMALAVGISAPVMLVTDHLRFLLPALWDLYPREDMFTVPLVFIVAGLAGKGYAKAYALSLSAAAPREPVSAASAELAAAGLSARELEVAALLARGLTYKVIRSQLGISEGTVQSHVSSVYRKIGVNCKEDLIIRFGSALCGDRKPII